VTYLETMAKRRARGRRLEWTAGPTHPLGAKCDVRVRRWPPFFSVLFFLPRIEVALTNDGQPIERGSATLWVIDYDGPIGDRGELRNRAWNDTAHQEVTNWSTGGTRIFRFTIRSRNLAHEGTYVARVEVARFRPLGGGTWAGEGPILTLELLEYFRVEPTSTVLTFWAVVGTLVTAVVALVVAVTTLVR
jgi:hypothetical protein